MFNDTIFPQQKAINQGLVPLTIKMLDNLPRINNQIVYNNTALRHILLICRIKISADDKTLQKQQIILNDDTGVLKCPYFYLKGLPKFSGEETYCKVVLLVRFYQQVSYYNIIAFKDCLANDLLQHYANILSNEVNKNSPQNQYIDNVMIEKVLKLVKQRDKSSFEELLIQGDINQHQLRLVIKQLLNTQQILQTSEPDTYRKA